VVVVMLMLLLSYRDLDCTEEKKENNNNNKSMSWLIKERGKKKGGRVHYSKAHQNFEQCLKRRRERKEKISTSISPFWRPL